MKTIFFLKFERWSFGHYLHYALSKMGELRSTIKILEDSHPNTYRHKQAGILGKYIEYQDSFSFMWVQPADTQNL